MVIGVTSNVKELVVETGEHQEKKFLLCMHFVIDCLFLCENDCEFGLKRSSLSLLARLKK